MSGTSHLWPPGAVLKSTDERAGTYENTRSPSHGFPSTLPPSLAHDLGTGAHHTSRARLAAGTHVQKAWLNVQAEFEGVERVAAARPTETRADGEAQVNVIARSERHPRFHVPPSFARREREAPGLQPCGSAACTIQAAGPAQMRPRASFCGSGSLAGRVSRW